MKIWAKCLGLVVIFLLVLACAKMEKFNYESDRELKPGPGLFTGKEGGLVIYRK